MSWDELIFGFCGVFVGIHCLPFSHFLEMKEFLRTPPSILPFLGSFGRGGAQIFQTTTTPGRGVMRPMPRVFTLSRQAEHSI